MMILLVFIAWYLIGIASFLFWWSREFAITTTDLSVSLAIGLTGPIAWILGYSLHHRRANIDFFGRKIK
jgi:hypothetical protein